MPWKLSAVELVGGGVLKGTKAASLKQVTEVFGTNPRHVGFYIRASDKLARPGRLHRVAWPHLDGRHLQPDTPLEAWTKMFYGDSDWSEAIGAQGVIHDIQWRVGLCGGLV
ncbi:hypothetical protein GGR57DRAFT_506053 [Xylariaceae sp. FL1272]|nr:hypothetical protein GGR57DRAFT_506053 [Xylariaceae sp. FL1272]